MPEQKKISDMTYQYAPSLNAYVPIVQGGNNYKIYLRDILELMGDYVTASGESEGWEWIEMKNGVKACWKRFTSQEITFTAVGSIYYGTLNGFSYPFSFDSTPLVLIDVYNSGGHVWHTQSSTGDTDNSPDLVIFSPTSTSRTCSVNVFAISRPN